MVDASNVRLWQYGHTSTTPPLSTVHRIHVSPSFLTCGRPTPGLWTLAATATTATTLDLPTATTISWLQPLATTTTTTTSLGRLQPTLATTSRYLQPLATPIATTTTTTFAALWRRHVSALTCQPVSNTRPSDVHGTCSPALGLQIPVADPRRATTTQLDGPTRFYPQSFGVCTPTGSRSGISVLLMRLSSFPRQTHRPCHNCPKSIRRTDC